MAKSSLSHSFTPEEIHHLKTYRDRQDDVRLKLRFVALLMLTEGQRVESIASVIGYSERSIERWMDHYLAGGINRLNSLQYQGRAPYLDEAEQHQLADWVQAQTPGNLKTIVAYIQEQFGVVYSTDAVSKLLKRQGFQKKAQNATWKRP